MCIGTWQLGTAWSVIILLLRYQTSDFQEMYIPQIITGIVFNFPEAGEKRYFHNSYISRIYSYSQVGAQ
jgi:hypothetical protein